MANRPGSVDSRNSSNLQPLSDKIRKGRIRKAHCSPSTTDILFRFCYQLSSFCTSSLLPAKILSLALDAVAPQSLNAQPVQLSHKKSYRGMACYLEVLPIS